MTGRLESNACGNIVFINDVETNAPALVAAGPANQITGGVKASGEQAAIPSRVTINMLHAVLKRRIAENQNCAGCSSIDSESGGNSLQTGVVIEVGQLLKLIRR